MNRHLPPSKSIGLLDFTNINPLAELIRKLASRHSLTH